MEKRLAKLDYYIFDTFVNRTRCKFLNKFIPVYTHIGDMGLIWLVFILIFLNYPPTRYQGFFIGVTLLISSVVSNLIFKPIFRRDRPFEIDGQDGEDELLINAPSTHSFPSGHATTSFAVALAMFSVSAVLGWLSIFLALTIAFSRMYLYVHYPSDIVGGMILGTICWYISYIIFF